MPKHCAYAYKPSTLQTPEQPHAELATHAINDLRTASPSHDFYRRKRQPERAIHSYRPALIT